METGKGYNLCKNICKQHNHAEVDAIQKAGKRARNGELFLYGHTYCCDSCKNKMNEMGITEHIQPK